MKVLLCVMALAFAVEGRVRESFKPCRDLPSCLCSDSEPMVMACEGTELMQVPASKYSSSVAYLALSDNRLGAIPDDAFSSYSHVRAMYLSNSGIRSIHKDAFEKVPTLKELDLSFNPLKELHPDTFAENPVLQTLVLMANEFLRLPEGPVLASASLTKLDLSYCGISALSPDAFSRLPNLRHLDLVSNRLATLAASTLRPLPLLEELLLEGNKWRCDCSLHELLGWTDTLHGRPPHYRATMCVADDGKNEMLWSLDEQGQQCAPTENGSATRQSSTEMSRSQLTVEMQKSPRKTIINSKSGVVSENGKGITERLLERAPETKNKIFNFLNPEITSLDGKDTEIEKKVVEIERQALGSSTLEEIYQEHQTSTARLEERTVGNSKANEFNLKDTNFINREQEEDFNEHITLISSTTFEIVFIIVLACISIAFIVLTGLLIMYCLSESHNNVYSLLRSNSQDSNCKGPDA